MKEIWCSNLKLFFCFVELDNIGDRNGQLIPSSMLAHPIVSYSAITFSSLSYESDRWWKFFNVTLAYYCRVLVLYMQCSVSKFNRGFILKCLRCHYISLQIEIIKFEKRKIRDKIMILTLKFLKTHIEFRLDQSTLYS